MTTALRRGLPVALGAALLARAAGATTVQMALSGAITNRGPDMSGALMMELSSMDLAEGRNSIRITLHDFAADIAPISSVFLTGGPVLDARLVSCSGGTGLWGVRSTGDAPARPDRRAPTVVDAPRTAPATVQALIWESTLSDGASLDDVVAGLTGTSARPAWLHLGLRVSTPGLLGHAGDTYLPSSVLAVPLPRGAATGFTMLAALAGLNWLRHRGRRGV